MQRTVRPDGVVVTAPGFDDQPEKVLFAERMIASVLGKSPDLNGRERQLRDIKNWVSMKHLQLILVPERGLSLTLAPEDIERPVTVGGVRRQNS